VLLFNSVLITGGAGFIGCNFVRMLVEGKLPFSVKQITVLDSLTYASNIDSLQDYIDSGDIDFVRGDITDKDLVIKLTKGVQLIVNFAAESHVDRSIASSEDFIKSNVLGVDVLLNAMRVNSVTTFLQVSTDEVYGSIEFGSWDENQPLKPNSPYSASKASADLLVLAHGKTHRLDVRITRCCNNYGLYQNVEKFLPTCINQLKKGEKIPLYGIGAQVREWIHVEDHCVGIGTVISRGRPMEIYNIGSGEELSNLQLAELVGTGFEGKSDFIEFVPDRKGHDFRYSVNFSKIQQLGYSPRMVLRQEIGSLVRWYGSR
jgi:dTDP-glucose 4,6-dehydratase